MLRETLTLQLPDGRTLGWAEYGDPSGRPVLYFHGGLSSRVDVRFASELCRSEGVRLLALDRPGVGISSRAPGRRMLDWPVDVGLFLDRLELARADLLGWSAGGPYVLACARAIPERLGAVATLAGMGPLDRPGALAELGVAADRWAFRFSRWAPWVAMVGLRLTAMMGRRALRRMLMTSVTSASDRRVVTAMSEAEATDFLYEAVRHGVAGTVEDYRVLARPWGFCLSEITKPVTIWHGEEDDLLPMSHARHLADSLPAGQLQRLPGVGHFVMHREGARILDRLKLS